MIYLAEGVEQVFEAVGLDDVNRFKLLSQFATGEAFLFEPDDVGFGQVDKQASAVFSKGHARLGKFEQSFGIGGQFFHGA